MQTGDLEWLLAIARAGSLSAAAKARGVAVSTAARRLDALEAELMAYCRENLSPVKCPRSIDFDPALPRHETGKLYKRLLKDRYRPA